MQRWWNLSKLVINTLVGLILVIFQLHNLHPPPSLLPPSLLPPSLPPPLLSAGEKIDLQKTVCEEWVSSFCLEGNYKNLGESFAWRHEWKWPDSIFWLTNVFASNLNTITLKLFHNHGGIYRFRKKFKKDSGEINPLWVHGNMRGCILEVYCEKLGWLIDSMFCLPFCWSWPEGWDNFQKRQNSRKWGDWFWNGGYRHLGTVVLEVKQNFMQRLSAYLLLFLWQKNSF